MHRLKNLFAEGFANARRASRGKWLAVGLIMLGMFVIGAFGFSIG
jgi:hypothetical protein